MTGLAEFFQLAVSPKTVLGAVGALLFAYLSYRAGQSQATSARAAQAAAEFRKAISTAEANLPAPVDSQNLGLVPFSWVDPIKEFLRAGQIAVHTFEPYLSARRRDKLLRAWSALKDHCLSSFGAHTAYMNEGSQRIFDRKGRLASQEEFHELVRALRAIANET